MFSKNVQTVLTYLAILIILYGAYKAIVGVHEGAKGNKVKRGLDKIKSSSKSTKKYCRKWTKNIKKRRRKKNSAKQAKKIQGVANKMCYVGCEQVGRLGLSCGAGPGGAGPGGCPAGYSSKAEWDSAKEKLMFAHRIWSRILKVDEKTVDKIVEMSAWLLQRMYANNACNGSMPTILIEALNNFVDNNCLNKKTTAECQRAGDVIYFFIPLSESDPGAGAGAKMGYASYDNVKRYLVSELKADEEDDAAIEKIIGGDPNKQFNLDEWLVIMAAVRRGAGRQQDPPLLKK